MKARYWVAVRILVGFIFAYAGAAKLLEPAANFEAVLLRYGVFSPAWIPWLARTVPWFEWLMGSFLVLGYAPRLAAGAISFLALCFLVTLGSSPLFLQSGGTDCGCFGQSGFLHLTLRQIFAVDLVSFVAGLRLAFLEDPPWSFDALLVKRRGGSDDIRGEMGKTR